MTLPAGRPDEIVAVVRAHGGVPIDVGVGVGQPRSRHVHVAEGGGEPGPPVALVCLEVPREIGDQFGGQLTLLAQPQHDVEDVVAVVAKAADDGAAVLAAQPRIEAFQAVEADERPDQLDRPCGDGARHHPHLRVVVPENVAAARVHTRCAEAAGITERNSERDKSALGAQVPVPDHFGDADGHQEATPFEADVVRFDPEEREIEARVPRAVVVTDQTRAGEADAR